MPPSSPAISKIKSKACGTRSPPSAGNNKISCKLPFQRFICVSTTAIYLISFVTMAVPAMLAQIPKKTVYEFQGTEFVTKILVWRIFTGSLVHI